MTRDQIRDSFQKLIELSTQSQVQTAEQAIAEVREKIGPAFTELSLFDLLDALTIEDVLRFANRD